jgi:thiol-disulfide isomerase/thioredoxin
MRHSPILLSASRPTLSASRRAAGPPESAPRGIERPVLPFLAFVLAVLAAGTSTAVLPAGDHPLAVLHLVNGGQTPGALVPSDDPELLRWQSPAFVSPFAFTWNAVSAVHFPVPAELPKPKGEFCFELIGGDVLYGELLELGPDEALVEAAVPGRVYVRRNRILRIDRWRDGAGFVYLGPNGLSDWKPSSPGQWHDETGQVLTNQPNAMIQGDFRLPAKASIEFELSWTKKADFSLAFGVNADKPSVERAFRIEAWDSDLIIVRETPTSGNIALLKTLTATPGHIHLQLFLDQEAGRCLVYSDRGEPLADLTVAEEMPKVRPEIRLTNKAGGDLRLELLRIGRWNGDVPAKVEPEKSRLHLVDGSIVYGRVSAFDATAKEFVVRGETGESRIPQGTVAAIALAPPSTGAPRNLVATFADSTRLSGEIVKVDGQNLRLSTPDIREPLTLPLADLHSLMVRHHVAPVATEDGRVGTLEIEGTKLRGQLVDESIPPDVGSSAAGPLVWQPVGSKSASPLRADVRGKIVYREPPSPTATSAPAQASRGRRPANALEGFVQAIAGQPSASHPRRAKSLYLRTGDAIPCEVTGIDEHGLSFTTPVSDTRFVSHEKIKAVELTLDGPGTVHLSRIKRDRLLTLPRLQKENPPTHMIRSRNGDYLRGRILRMDDSKLLVEVRLDTRELPRDRISRIIWLHPEDLTEDRSGPEAPEAARAMRVQALRSDGIRLTFLADKVADGALSGTSEVLGPVRVTLDKVDQILIGGEIEQTAARLAFQQWKLENAVEPKFASGGAGEGGDSRSTGVESALVGKPAPDFELEMLGGGKFRLANRRGRIVVLDFWATWCGPCVQAMPQVDQVRRDFAERNVEVVAVNLEEAPKPITAMLERHKLELPVALDRDGAIAARYNVTSIPQTLVINSEGTVVRHFIGGGPHLGESLQAVLKELLDGTPAGKVEMP